MSSVQRLNLAMRVMMEVGVVAALASWGVHTGNSVGTEILLGVGVPAVAFGFWGAVDFRRTGRPAEPLRLTQELVVSGLAALAWYDAGLHGLGIALATLSLVYHAAVYVSGRSLLKPRRREPAES